MPEPNERRIELREGGPSGKIYPRGKNDVWYFEYWHPAQKKTIKRSSADSVLGRKGTEQDAERALLEHLERLVVSPRANPDSERVTLKQILERLFARQELKGRRSTRTTRICGDKLTAFFGMHERAERITENRIDEYQEHRVGEGAAPSSVDRELATLRAAFNEAVRKKLIREAPVIELLNHGNVREGFVEVHQLEKIVEHLSSDHGDLATFLFWSAWRIGEAKWLPWDFVEMDRDGNPTAIRLSFRKSKSKHARTLPLVGPLRGVIRRRLERRAVECKDSTIAVSSTVFHRGDGKPIGDIRKRWAKATEAAGCADVTPHDLRRSGIRMMRQAGCTEHEIMEISGHRNPNVFRRYDINVDDDRRRTLERTARYHRTEPRDEANA